MKSRKTWKIFTALKVNFFFRFILFFQKLKHWGLFGIFGWILYDTLKIGYIVCPSSLMPIESDLIST